MNWAETQGCVRSVIASRSVGTTPDVQNPFCLTPEILNFGRYDKAKERRIHAVRQNYFKLGKHQSGPRSASPQCCLIEKHSYQLEIIAAFPTTKRCLIRCLAFALFWTRQLLMSHLMPRTFSLALQIRMTSQPWPNHLNHWHLTQSLTAPTTRYSVSLGFKNYISFD